MKTEKWNAIARGCGKTATTLAKVAVGLFGVGAVCAFIADKKSNNKKKLINYEKF